MKFMFGLTPQQLAPILNMQQIAHDDNVLRNFSAQSLQQEDLMRRQRSESQAAIMARESGSEQSKIVESKEKTEQESARAYTISYFNPELGKTEVLQQKADVRITDPSMRAVEEAAAAQSVLPIYSFVGTPLMRTEVVPWKLQQILDEREYGTPPPPPSGAGVTPIKVVQRKESEIVAEKKRDDLIRAAFAEVVLRKEKSEEKVAEEILLLEDALEALRRGDPIDKIISRLPPLSRARYTLAMRKKSLGRYAMMQLLLREILFLKGAKKKLELFTLDDLVSMFKLIRGLQRR